MGCEGHHGNYRQESQGSIAVRNFVQRLEDLGNNLSKMDDKDIFHPEGYACKIVAELDLKGVQLRRFYLEVRSIYEGWLNKKEKGGLNKEGEKELKYRLYRLYAITQYQENRGIIKREFGKLLRRILDSLEENFTEENLRKATDFLMAMVAYSKKEKET